MGERRAEKKDPQEQSLLAALRAAGQEVELTGNTPFFLDGADRVWGVLEGQVDVFFTLRAGETQAGPRSYLFTACRGDLLFGMGDPVSQQEEGLIVAGIPGTRVVACSREAFFAVAGTRSAEAADGVDRFLEGLGRGIVKDIAPLPRIRRFQEKMWQALEPDQCAAPDGFLAWIRIDAGRALFTGTEDLPPSPSWCALPTCCWILPGSDTQITVRRTEEILASGEFVSSFDGWRSLAFSLLSMNALFQAGDDLGNLRSRQRADRDALSRACTDLAAALDERGAGRYGTDGSPLGAVCAKVLDVLGIDVPLPRSCADKDLFDVAFECDLRLREVRLGEDWWHQDGEPLIAFLEERPGRKKPVALLPGNGGYRLWDEGIQTPLSASLSQNLGGTAWQIHAPLPAEPLGLRSFLSFGLKGLGREGGASLALEVSIALLALVSPVVNGLVFGESIPWAERGQLAQLLAILVSVAISSGLLRFAREISHSRWESRINYRLVLGLWDRLLRLPTKFFSSFQAGDLVNRGIGLLSIRRVISPALRMLRIQGLFFLFFLCQAFWYAPRSALAGSVCLLVLGVMAAFSVRATLVSARLAVPLQNRILALTYQILHGMAKIRGSGSEHRAFERWADLESRKRRLATEVRKKVTLLESSLVIFPLLGTGAVFLSLERTGMVDTGHFMAFLSAWGGLQVAFVALLSSLVTLASALPLAENLRPILEARPESGTGKADPGRITGKIDMENVTFRYHPDGRPILSDVHLHIRPGEFVAVVGPSGSGKSTLLRLLLGFEVPETGSIFYDSKDLNDMDLKKLRSQIGVVLQGGGLLAGDLLSNVRCSRRLSLEQVEEALAVAGMREEVGAMPMGMHTVVGGEGGTLSGGQRQRLLIARAVAGNPRVLLFDEATSALDNRTQGQITRSLERIEATRIVVAHRLSTVVGADRIVVLDGGRIQEDGTYADLMARKGLFFGLAKRQILG